MDENYSYELYCYGDVAWKGNHKQMFIDSGKWIRHLTIKAQLLLYLPPDLIFINSTFRQRTVFMCYVWISENTAIFFPLYSINWLGF